MQELGVSKDIVDRLRSKHMRRLLEEHEYVLQSYWAQRFGEGQGGERKGNKGVKRRIQQQKLLSLNMLYFSNVFQHVIFFSTCCFFRA